MKRGPLIASFVLFLVLCASAAYWAMQLLKPASRPVAAPPRAQVEARTDTAAGLFGGRGTQVAAASNYQLRGVIFSGSEKDSVAIISTDGKPAQAIRVNAEIAPGVTISEVHRNYVILSDNGESRRVELPENLKGQSGIATAAPVGAAPRATPPTPQPPPSTPPPAPQAAPQPQPQPQAAPAPAPAAQPQPEAQAPVQQQQVAPSAPAVQSPPPTMFSSRPPAGTSQLNPPSPPADSNFGTPSPPLYSPGRPPQ